MRSATVVVLEDRQAPKGHDAESAIAHVTEHAVHLSLAFAD